MKNDCVNKEKNLKRCTCTYPGCSKKGICCECLHYHLSRKEVPACFFDREREITYNRSLNYFIDSYRA